MRHLLFGDSISVGVGDYENGGWASQLRLFIDRQKKLRSHNLINLAISGDTSRGLLNRMEREAVLRIRDMQPEEFTLLIAIGTNDSRVNKADASTDVPIEEFKANMLKLIDIGQRLTSEVILIGPVPVDEELTGPYKEQKYYSNERIQAYNEVLKIIAREKNLRFVEFFPTWMKLDYPKLFEDGLHPNTDGHKLMFETVRDQLFLKA